MDADPDQPLRQVLDDAEAPALLVDKRRRVDENTAGTPVGHSEVPLMELQMENHERAQIHGELSQLTAALEQRLFDTISQLEATRSDVMHQSQRRIEAELQIGQLNAELARQKTEAVQLGQELESLSFSISHDLKAPLRHLLGFSSALQEDYGERLDSSGQGYITCIIKAAQKLESQIDALLGLSRVTRHRLSLGTVDLSQLVRESVALLQGSDPKRTARFEVADHLEARADAYLLRIALDNLLDNAWKFTRGREDARIQFGRKQDGETSVYFVRDNGVGFDTRYADRLFGAFQRMHRGDEFEGMGTGLATVQRIIHRHGGRVWADATVDGGATFCFTLGE